MFCFSIIAQTDFDLLIFLPLKLVHNYVCYTSKLMPLLSHTYLFVPEQKMASSLHVWSVVLRIIECDVVFLSAARSSVLSFVLPSANSECISISPNKLLLRKSRSSWLQCVKFSTITDFRTVSSIFSNYKCILWFLSDIYELQSICQFHVLFLEKMSIWWMMSV